MCVLIFSTTFVWNISHSKKKKTKYVHRCLSVLVYVKYLCSSLMKTEFSWLIFEE